MESDTDGTRPATMQGVSVLKRIQGALDDITKADWTPDRSYSAGGSIVRFVSLVKMKATLCPILQRHGLIVNVRFDRPVQLDPLTRLTQHWMVRMTVRLIDVDTGEYIEDIVWGEAADSLDKAVTKAESFAFKQWLSTRFLLADGMDESTAEQAPTFRKESEQDREEAKSRILAQGVPPAEAKDQAKTKDKDKGKGGVKEGRFDPPTEPAPAEPQGDLVSPEKPVQAPEPPTPPTPPEPPQRPTVKLSGPQAKAMETIASTYMRMLMDGRISKEDYDRMASDRDAVTSPADAVEFIKRYRP